VRRARRLRSEEAGNFTEFGSGVADGSGKGIEALSGLVAEEWKAGRRFVAGFLPWSGHGEGLTTSLAKDLAGAGKRVSLGVDEALDFKGSLDVAAAIEALAGSALVGFELRKLRFPEAQDVSFETADAGDIADFEVETVWDGGGGDVAPTGELRGHEKNEGACATIAGSPLLTQYRHEWGDLRSKSARRIQQD
jgi:hypothetical protein